MSSFDDLASFFKLQFASSWKIEMDMDDLFTIT